MLPSSPYLKTEFLSNKRNSQPSRKGKGERRTFQRQDPRTRRGRAAAVHRGVPLPPVAAEGAAVHGVAARAAPPGCSRDCQASGQVQYLQGVSDYWVQVFNFFFMKLLEQYCFGFLETHLGNQKLFTVFDLISESLLKPIFDNNCTYSEVRTVHLF